MKCRIRYIVCLIGFIFFIQGKGICQGKNNFLTLKEDSLKYYGNQIVNGEFPEQRFRADSQFTRILVRALQHQHSFHYPFDSLTTISRLYSPDSSFRIFTWQVSKDENTHRRHGAIQMNTKDGSLKLFPLIDRSILIQKQQDTITNNTWWIGAIYYKILKHVVNQYKIYTLLGYDENNRTSTRKLIEILTFDREGQPIFGLPLFDFSNDSIKKSLQTRFFIEYKKGVNASIKYDDDLGMIMYDHLISESNEEKRFDTYVPDGDYEAFKWTNGKWLHVDKPFDFKLEDGQAPIIKPVTDSKIPVKKSVKKGN